MLLLIFPGTKSELVSLQSVLKERHNALKAFTDKEIARRNAKSVPLDGLVAMDDYDPVAGYDDVKLRFIALSEEDRGKANAVVAVAQATRAALADKPIVSAAAEAAAADTAVAAAMVEYVKKAIAEVHIDGGLLDLGNAGVAAALGATGSLLTHLYLAAREYQGLSVGKEKRFGSAPPSTT